MLNSMRLQGFKSWSDTGILPLSRITGLFGTNSSGKSSILQALLLLKQTAATADPGLALHFGDPSTLTNLGDYSSVVHKHNTSSKISISIAWTNDSAYRHIPPSFQHPAHRFEDVQFDVTFATGSKAVVPAPIVDSFQYSLTGNHATLSLGIARDAETDSYNVFSDPPEQQSQLEGVAEPDTSPISFFRLPFDTTLSRDYMRIAASCQRQLDGLLSDMRYLGPLRAHPQRQYTWSGDSPIDTGYSGERTIHALLSATNIGARQSSSPRLRIRPFTEQRVAKWLQQLGLIHSFRVVPLVEGRPYFEVKVKRNPNSPEVLLAEVGFGVSQILPVLVLCLMVPRRTTIVLEQPELHLHPAVQSTLADILIEAATDLDVQIIVESHSEHLLRRLQRRVAEAELVSEEDVALYFCANDGAASSVTALELDTYGNIGNWPQGFFGDQFGEIAETTKAGLRRRSMVDGS